MLLLKNNLLARFIIWLIVLQISYFGPPWGPGAQDYVSDFFNMGSLVRITKHFGFPVIKMPNTLMLSSCRVNLSRVESTLLEQNKVDFTREE